MAAAGVTRRLTVRGWIAARRARLLVTLVAASSAVFILLAFALKRSAGTPADLAITARVQQIDVPGFEPAMVLVSALGFTPLNWLIVPAVAAGFWLAGFRREALFVAATPGAGLLSAAAKLVVARPRPGSDAVRVLGEVLEYSFPSSHVVTYVSTFGFLFFLTYVLFKRSRWRTIALVVLGLLVALVGLSRIALGHHWASDVLGGYALGMVYLVILIQVYRATSLKLHPLEGARHRTEV